MNTKIALISALAPVSIALAFTFASPAKATSLSDSCHANSAGQTVACCKTWVKQNGTPIWMDHAGMSCTDVAACAGGGGGRRLAATLSVAPNRRCHINMIVLQDTSGGTTPPPPAKGRSRN